MHMHAFRERDYHSSAMAFLWKGRNLLDRVSFDLALALRASPKASPYLFSQNLYLRIPYKRYPPKILFLISHPLYLIKIRKSQIKG